MKRLVAYGLFLALMILFPACQKEQAIPESKSGIQYYYHSGTEEVIDATFLRDGGMAFVGAGLGKGYIFVTDENGKERWKSYIGGNELDIFYSLIELMDGSFVALGATFSYSLDVTNDDPDAWMVKFSPSGKVIWQKTFGEDFREVFVAGMEDNNGDLVLVGYQSPSNRQSLLAKFTANGDLIYSKTFRVGPWHSTFEAIAQAPTGEYVIGGLNSQSTLSSQVGNHVTNMLLVNPDSGQVLMTRIFQDYVRSNYLGARVKVDVSITGNEVTLASFFEEPIAKSRIQIIRANMDGTLIFEKKFSGEGEVYFNNLERSNDGGYILCGQTTAVQNSQGAVDVLGAVIKLSPDCEEEWSSAFGVPDINLSVWSVKQTLSGYRVIGQSSNNKRPLRQMMAYRLNNKGEIVYE